MVARRAERRPPLARPQTEYAAWENLDECPLVSNRLRSRTSKEDSSDSLCSPPAGGHYGLRSVLGASLPKSVGDPEPKPTRKPRKWTPRPDKDAPPLPPGWREEIRLPLSGRKYRVFIGPEAGLYAESRSKAWDAHRRVECRSSTPAEEPTMDEEGAPAKKKRARKACLPCDFGRKRKCTCGRRVRGW